MHFTCKKPISDTEISDPVPLFGPDLLKHCVHKNVKKLYPKLLNETFFIVKTLKYKNIFLKPSFGKKKFCWWTHVCVNHAHIACLCLSAECNIYIKERLEGISSNLKQASTWSQPPRQTDSILLVIGQGHRGLMECHSSEHDMSRTPWGKFATNIYLDSNWTAWSDFGVVEGQGLCCWMASLNGILVSTIFQEPAQTCRSVEITHVCGVIQP